MTAPGSMWDKLPKVGKAVGHALGGGRYVDAIDALSGVNDPDVQSFVARAERSLADNGTAWSAIPEVDRDAAADVLTEVLDSLLPTDVWGDALLSANHVREHVMASGGAAALDRFAVRDISTDTSITEPGRVLQSGAATPEGRAFTMLLEVACDALHMRAIAASDVDVAVLIGGLRKIAAGQIDAEDRLSAKLSRINGLLAELSQTTGRHPRRRLIRVGEDAWPREAEAFVVRPELDTIRETLARESTVTVCQLNGMRGVGKSQLAAAYARECDAAGYEVVAWIDARSRESVIANMSRLVAEYAPGDPDENPETGIKRLLDRFGSAPDEHRLIVFDNVERFADLDGVLPSDLETKVITTTILTTGVLGPRVPVEVFTELVAADYLETRTQLADPEGARRVSQEVGCLALALAQAASTITARGYSYDRFLSALIARPIHDNLLREEGSDYRLGAAQAIDLAIETVVTAVGDEGKTQDDSLCTKTEAVFDALVLLANTGVPIEWLRALGDEFRIDEAVARLVGSSLAEYSEDKTSVRLHRLTRRVYAEERIVEETTRDRARQAALAALATGLPDEDEGTYEARRAALAHWLPYLATLLTDLSPVLAGPHFVSVAQRGVYLGNGHHLPYAVIACAALPDEVTRVLGPGHPDTLTSRNNLAGAYRSAGDLGQAIPLYQATLADSERVLGPDHPDTLTSRNNLAGAYRSAGDLGQAIPLYQATLADSERVLGPDHPNTLTSRNNLAYAYESAGDLGQAIPLYQATLADSERVLGPDHPDTLTSRNNLAGAYESAGDLGQAIPLYQATLADRERVLGPDHPDTLTSRNNLAYAYESAGDLGQAIPLYQATLADSERVLGPDHPDTLTSRNNLAYAYESAGDLGQAIPLYQATLADSERVLGPDHPDTLTSRNNLAGAYQSAGDLGQAIPLYQATLADRERVLGPDHPNTLTSRNNLAGAYRSAGDLGQAIPLYQATLADSERVLGPDHPNTLASRNNLAGAYQSAGDLGQAIPLYQATLADSERVFGPDHPNTLTSRNNLAYAYESAGDLGQAIPLYQATLADSERVLGPDHPDTLTSRNNLAGAYQSAGDLGQAIPLYQATLADRERVLGPDHPNTLTSRNNLAYAYESAGDLGQAIPLYQATLADRERVLGPDHPDTLTSRNNLAYAYESAGDLGQAIPLYQATLADSERVLGPDHPNTLTSRNNLAIALWTNGDRASALRQMQRAAERAVQVLSGTHPLATHLTEQADEMRRMMSDDPK